MASRLNPYLNFDGNTREAMEFYRSVLGGDLDLTTFGDFGAKDIPADKIMHSLLQTDAGFALMAADLPPGQPHQPGSNFAISISGDNTDGDELRGYWEKLSDGGKVLMPLEKQVWGDEFGACVDRFGIQWMVNIGQPQS